MIENPCMRSRQRDRDSTVRQLVMDLYCEVQKIITKYTRSGRSHLKKPRFTGMAAPPACPSRHIGNQNKKKGGKKQARSGGHAPVKAPSATDPQKTRYKVRLWFVYWMRLVSKLHQSPYHHRCVRT